MLQGKESGTTPLKALSLYYFFSLYFGKDFISVWVGKIGKAKIPSSLSSSNLLLDLGETVWLGG